jgi:glutaredoxin 3
LRRTPETGNPHATPGMADPIMKNVQIYTTANCAFCVAAKMLLKQRGLDYEEIRVDTDPARRDEMVARTQRRSVPQILIGERVIGGYEELAAAARSGQLESETGGAA